MSRFAARIVLTSALACALFTAVTVSPTRARAAATCPAVAEGVFTTASAKAVKCVLQGIAESRAPIALLRKVVEEECRNNIALPAFAATILTTLAGPTGFALNIEHLKGLKSQIDAVQHWYASHHLRADDIAHLEHAQSDLGKAIFRLNGEDGAIRGAAQSAQSQDCGSLKKHLTAEGDEFLEYFDLAGSATDELDKLPATAH